MQVFRKVGIGATISLCLALSVACKPEAQARPKPALELTGRVVDKADLLAPEVEQQLTERLAKLESDTKVQFAVVTTPSLGGEDVNTYTMALGNAWGLGDAKRNDGLILLVAPNERKVRIEVRKGLEPTLTNPLCAEILSELTSNFANGQMSEGIVQGEQRLESEIRSRLPKGIS